MFENIAALDIGTSRVKLVTVKTGFRDFQVTSLSQEDVDHSIEDQDEALRDALSRLLREKDLKGHTLYTNLPMEKAIIRNINFPFSDVEKIAEAIPFEAEENIPFKLEDLSMDFQPLKNINPDEGRILLAATHRDTIYDFLGIFKEFDITPVRMGLESNALFECYRYFNKIESESVIQLDIGHDKTIINMIKDNSLLYTRSISVGTGMIIDIIAGITKSTYAEAANLYERLHLDLTSFENNIQRDSYKGLGLTRQRFQKIYDGVIAVVDELVEQIVLTTKSFHATYDQVEFNRLLISGGGANIVGIGHLLSGELELPIVSLPFLEGYEDIRLHTQFPIVFGTVLSAMNRKSPSINFLKGEFLPDIVSESKKIYYLAGTFTVLAVILLVFKIITGAVLESRTGSRYESLLQERYKRYFHGHGEVDDPVREAQKLLAAEKKEFGNLENIVQSDVRVMEVMKDILDFFPRDESYVLKNLVINENIVRFDGTTSAGKNLDDFKNKLIESKKFESAVLNTNIKRGNQVGFSMTIKLKNAGGRGAESRKVTQDD